uniref:Conserved membrane protein n=1 Tax=Panagrellus redivivus TaxID=6233 RepID=A0A7E4UVI8_PANRE
MNINARLLVLLGWICHILAPMVVGLGIVLHLGGPEDPLLRNTQVRALRSLLDPDDPKHINPGSFSDLRPELS